MGQWSIFWPFQWLGKPFGNPSHWLQNPRFRCAKVRRESIETLPGVEPMVAVTAQGLLVNNGGHRWFAKLVALGGLAARFTRISPALTIDTHGLRHHLVVKYSGNWLTIIRDLPFASKLVTGFSGLWFTNHKNNGCRAFFLTNWLNKAVFSSTDRATPRGNPQSQAVHC